MVKIFYYRYLESVEDAGKGDKSRGADIVDGTRIISMTLYGSSERYTWGAIRNAQLVPVYYPGWRLRVYLPSTANSSSLLVPSNVINILKSLGTQIAYVYNSSSVIAARDWRLLVVDDLNVDCFLIRDADGRLSERDSLAVNDWISQNSDHHRRILHCIRDHRRHIDRPIVDGLWGAHSRYFRQYLNGNYLLSSSLNSTSRMNLLWTLMSNVSLCHDSVSVSNRWIPDGAETRPLPNKHRHHFVGRHFDQHEVGVEKWRSLSPVENVKSSLQSVEKQFNLKPALRFL